jgi:hypothetical protein
MKAIPNSVVFFRLAVMLTACWAAPPLLCYYAGAVVGALAAGAAGALWYSQYRVPSWQERRGYAFWFVAGGYGVAGVTLLVCLGRLLR